MNVLYISYDGMTDLLGQSQVIPYLAGLSQKGHKIHIISCEKKKTYMAGRDGIYEIFSKYGIDWTPLRFSTFPPYLSKLFDVYNIRRTATRLHRKTPFDLVHCRSYVAAFVGLYLKKHLGVRFLFDMRGFWVDERFEGNLWDRSNFLFRLAYKYFKQRESVFFKQADAIVSLTQTGRQIIGKTFGKEVEKITSVIPCCVDPELFSAKKITQEAKASLRETLGIEPAHFVVSYVGSIGTWYMTFEMMRFFKRLLKTFPDARFLFISGEDPNLIFSEVQKARLDISSVIVSKASRQQVPQFLSLSDISLYFIKPVFSKKASSPAKQAEILSMGIPIITNAGIGDTDRILNESGAGILVENFTEEAFDRAIKKIPDILKKHPDSIRQCAIKNFNLETGIEMYHAIYKDFER